MGAWKELRPGRLGDEARVAGSGGTDGWADPLVVLDVDHAVGGAERDRVDRDASRDGLPRRLEGLEAARGVRAVRQEHRRRERRGIAGPWTGGRALGAGQPGIGRCGGNRRAAPSRSSPGRYRQPGWTGRWRPQGPSRHRRRGSRWRHGPGRGRWSGGRRPGLGREGDEPHAEAGRELVDEVVAADLAASRRRGETSVAVHRAARRRWSGSRSPPRGDVDDHGWAGERECQRGDGAEVEHRRHVAPPAGRPGDDVRQQVHVGEPDGVAGTAALDEEVGGRAPQAPGAARSRKSGWRRSCDRVPRVRSWPRGTAASCPVDSTM